MVIDDPAAAEDRYKKMYPLLHVHITHGKRSSERTSEDESESLRLAGPGLVDWMAMLEAEKKS